MKYLTKPELRNLPTPRLLKYKKKYFASDASECFYWSAAKWDRLQYQKDLAEWRKLYKFIKELLAKREHIE